MTDHCIHAFTEPGPTYPAFVSLNTRDQKHYLTVRSPAHSGMMSGTIEMTEAQLVDLARSIIHNFCPGV